MRNAISLWRDGSFNSLADLHRDVERIFNSYSGVPESSRAASQAWFNPACDIEETESHFLISLDVPGLKKEDIEIELHDGTLKISGNRSLEKGGSRWTERSFGKFQRVFNLPSTVDRDAIEAAYQDGVLSVAVPKAEAAKPRQVKIGESKSGVLSKLFTSRKEGSPENAA